MKEPVGLVYPWREGGQGGDRSYQIPYRHLSTIGVKPPLLPPSALPAGWSTGVPGPAYPPG